MSNRKSYKKRAAAFVAVVTVDGKPACVPTDMAPDDAPRFVDKTAAARFVARLMSLHPMDLEPWEIRYRTRFPWRYHPPAETMRSATPGSRTETHSPARIERNRKGGVVLARKPLPKRFQENRNAKLAPVDPEAENRKAALLQMKKEDL